MLRADTAVEEVQAERGNSHAPLRRAQVCCLTDCADEPAAKVWFGIILLQSDYADDYISQMALVAQHCSQMFWPQDPTAESAIMTAVRSFRFHHLIRSWFSFQHAGSVLETERRRLRRPVDRSCGKDIDVNSYLLAGRGTCWPADCVCAIVRCWWRTARTIIMTMPPMSRKPSKSICHRRDRRP